MDETKREEMAKTFAERECEIGQVDRDALYKGYYHGMKDFLSLPIADRLTEEEKEKIKRAHWLCKRWVPKNTHERLAAYDTCHVLEALFHDIVKDDAVEPQYPIDQL